MPEKGEKVFKCSDVGMSCDFEAHGKNDREILQKVTEHARGVHHMKQIPKEMEKKFKSAIHTL